MASGDFYVGRNPVRRWRAEVREGEEVIFFSPYVTSTTAETVLGAARTGTASLYTVLDPMLFASGASSIGTLRRLLGAKCKLFHVDRLHAKVMIVPDRFATVGSQNLTTGGTTRREATVAFSDAAIVAELHELVRPWVSAGLVVDEPLLANLEETVRKLRKEYRLLRLAQDEARRSFQRTLASAVSLEEAEALRRRAALRQLVEQRARRSEHKTVSLYRAPNWTLMHRGQDLLRWNTGGSAKRLNKKFRYLFVNTVSGRLSWARVMKTRISKFESSIRWTEPLRVFDHSYRVRFIALDPCSGANLRVDIDDGGLTVDYWFGAETLQRVAIVTSRISPALAAFRGALKDNAQHVEVKLVRRLLEPFLYEYRLTGEGPDGFLGTETTKWNLRLGELHGGCFIAAQPGD